MFEHHRAPLLPRTAFLRRSLTFAGFAAAFLSLSLALGAAGYHWLGELAWIDALLNAVDLPSGASIAVRDLLPALR